MNNQTESYIVLKPIAERFSKVSSEITDEEIKSLIKNVMKERIAQAINFDGIVDKIDNFLENNEEQICRVVTESINRRLELPRDYRWD